MAFEGFSLGSAARWADVPRLDPETERAAAETAIKFLSEVRAFIEAHLAGIEAGSAAADGSGLHVVWDFSEFPQNHIDFLLAALGEGEVRITLCGGEAKAGDTGIPGLWRMQTGRGGASNAFVLARLPRAVEVVAGRGLDKVPALVNPAVDVFAGHEILNEIEQKLAAADLSILPDRPAAMVELTRQPLSPGDMTAILSTLGKGEVEVECTGFAKSKMSATKVKGVWRSRIINNAGKNLLDAYVIAKVPPEVPIAAEEFRDAVGKCTDIIEWMKADIARGAVGSRKNAGKEAAHA